MSPSLSPITAVAGTAPSAKLLISPFAGEMSGRTEGGCSSAAVARRVEREEVDYTIPPEPPATAGRSAATLAR
ncbi:hypothetical protein FJ934_14795 [Mesorhizobium sp. B2-4-12]|nr:hypothetical protein FJ934_14795 [Mesorhizobium sp. B2-4-12]